MAVAELDSSLATVGQPKEGGSAWVSFASAPTYPTDATAAMSTLTSYSSLGELSTNGYTEKKDKSTNEFSGWHGSTILTCTDKTKNTIKCEFVEVDRVEAAKLRYGQANVTADTDGSWKQINDTDSDEDEVSLVFEELESNGHLVRTLIKRCKVTSLDDVPHKRGELVVYGMEFTVLKPADGSAETQKFRAKTTGV